MKFHETNSITQTMKSQRLSCVTESKTHGIVLNTNIRSVASRTFHSRRVATGRPVLHPINYIYIYIIFKKLSSGAPRNSGDKRTQSLRVFSEHKIQTDHLETCEKEMCGTMIRCLGLEKVSGLHCFIHWGLRQFLGVNNTPRWKVTYTPRRYFSK
jgi:hypothetical protein